MCWSMLQTPRITRRECPVREGRASFLAMALFPLPAFPPRGGSLSSSRKKGESRAHRILFRKRVKSAPSHNVLLHFSSSLEVRCVPRSPGILGARQDPGSATCILSSSSPAAAFFFMFLQGWVVPFLSPPPPPPLRDRPPSPLLRWALAIAKGRPSRSWCERGCRETPLLPASPASARVGPACPLACDARAFSLPLLPPLSPLSLSPLSCLPLFPSCSPLLFASVFFFE